MMRYLVYGVLLLITFGVVFSFAQDLPRFSQRVAVSGIAGIAQAFGFLFLAKYLRERRERRR